VDGQRLSTSAGTFGARAVQLDYERGAPKAISLGIAVRN